MANIKTDKWLYTETGPRGGVAPVTRFFNTRQAAKQFAQPRLALFERFDLAEVKYRVTVTLETRVDVAEDE